MEGAFVEREGADFYVASVVLAFVTVAYQSARVALIKPSAMLRAE